MDVLPSRNLCMCVCVYIYTYICQWMCFPLEICVCMCVCVCVYIYIYIYIYMLSVYVCMYVCMHACMHGMYVWVVAHSDAMDVLGSRNLYMCLCLYMRVDICMYDMCDTYVHMPYFDVCLHIVGTSAHKGTMEGTFTYTQGCAHIHTFTL